MSETQEVKNNALGTKGQMRSFMKDVIPKYLEINGLNYSAVMEKAQGVQSEPFPSFVVYANIEATWPEWHDFQIINQNSTWQEFIVQTISNRIGDPFQSETFRTKIDIETKPLHREIEGLKRELKYLETKVIEKTAIITYIEKSKC